MKLPPNPHVKFGLVATLLSLGVAGAFLIYNSSTALMAQTTAPKNPEKKDQTETLKSTPDSAKTVAPAPKAEASTNQASAPGSPGAPTPPTAEKNSSTPDKDTEPKTEPEKASEDIQLSFQGANIEVIVQWLAQTTGKSVVKHPRVQCQLTIVSSKKLPPRDAINLVYRGLALEGFTAVESSNSILIVPEGQEPKMSPELVGASRSDIPEGRQRLVKIFALKHIQAVDLKEKVRAVLSEKATIEVEERANQVIVTDYNENLRLLAELIKELDVSSVSDSVIEI